MKIVGLTGGSGSGKGRVGMLFREFGCAVIDTDALYHDMISSESDCSAAILSRFGSSVKNTDGGIDRRALAEIVFANTEALRDLNRIAHTYVRTECNKLIEIHKARGTEMLLIDAPQLFEAGMQDVCGVTVAVIADERIRIKRICARDSISEQKAEARIRAQYTDDFFRQNCTYVIENNHDLARLLVRVKNVYDEIKELQL